MFVALAYDPAEQFRHTVARAALLYNPTLQGTHALTSVADTVFEYVPDIQL